MNAISTSRPATGRRLRAALLLLTLLLAPGVYGQEDASVTEPLPLTDALVAQFDEQIATVERQRAEMTLIANRLATADDVLDEILARRLEQERIDVVNEGVTFARAVATQIEQGYAVGDYRTAAIEMLNSNVPVADAALTALAARTEFPESDLSAAEQAARNRVFIQTESSINEVIALKGDSLELLSEFGAPQEQMQSEFALRVRDRAVNASMYLDMAEEEAAKARASANAVPDDSEFSARSTVASALVSQLADLANDIVSELDRLGDDTAGYRQQIISVTGEITSDAISFSVIGSLISQWGSTIFDVTAQEGPAFLFRALVFGVILLIFYKLSRIARAIVERSVNRSNAALSQLLRRMIVSVVANLVLAIGLLIALSQLGISLGPLLAGLGIAGFIIGFALQDSLANFASGLMILFYRPYDVGDIVEVGGVLGKVDQMSLVNTTVNTFDNQRIIVPNSMIWGNTIKNVTAETVRRVDMVFGISYADDIPKTEELLKAIVTEHELVLDDPEPVVRLHELADSSVNFVVRPWTETANYWNVYWDVTRAVKLRFDEAGVSIPFPQRDVHLFSEGAGAEEMEEESA